GQFQGRDLEEVLDRPQECIEGIAGDTLAVSAPGHTHSCSIEHMFVTGSVTAVRNARRPGILTTYGSQPRSLTLPKPDSAGTRLADATTNSPDLRPPESAPEPGRKSVDELLPAHVPAEQLAHADATEARRGWSAQVLGGTRGLEQHRSVLEQGARPSRLGAANELPAPIVEQLVRGRPREEVRDRRAFSRVAAQVGGQRARAGVNTKRFQAGGDRLVDARAG